jgi:hypothetical protein
MQIGAFFSFVVVLILIFIPSDNIYLLSGLLFLLGFFSSALCVGYTAIVENNKLELAATATGIASLIIMGGGAIMKIFYGWILDWSWHGKMLADNAIYPAHAFDLAMLILPAAFALALIITLFIRETNCTAPHD